MSEADFLQQVRGCKEHLRMQIARAEFPEGTRLDEAQLRRETGATVRAVRAALSDLAREGLILRKRHVGTFVADRLPAANVTVLPKLRSVGLLSSRRQEVFISDGFCSKVLTGLRLALQPPAQVTWFLHEHGRTMGVDDLPLVDLDAIRRACQGVVAVEAYNASQLNELSRAGVPLVVVDFAPPLAAFDSVEVDHFQAGYLATRHLLELGHREIAYVGEGLVAQSTDPTWQARLNGYLRAMVEAGQAVSPAHVMDTQRNLRVVAERLPAFDARRRPSAYVLCTGGFADALVQVLADLGRAVPAQVSLAAADSAAYTAGGAVLSQARVDYEMLGRNAARVLAARLACKAMPPMRNLLPVLFAPGQTSAPCAKA
ncbi:MAG: substrate-binding domain-containing protein [Planctomycetota bacterium]|nr:substrate-binding domain-containing protein [Planctomycetota bacterium]